MRQSAVMAQTADEEFNPHLALSLVQSCVSDSGHVSMDYYIAAYQQMYKFLTKFGPAVLIVTTDLATRLDTLQKFRRSRAGDEYTTVQGMVHYEVENNLTTLESGSSGCSTLLRLHRALEFISIVLLKIQETAGRGEDLPSETAEVFRDTLGKFVPAVFLQYVVSALPHIPCARSIVVERLGLGDSPELTEFIQTVRTELTKMYDITQRLFAENGLLHLP